MQEIFSAKKTEKVSIQSNQAIECLQQIYNKLIPIEKAYQFPKFNHPRLISSEIASKPTIMVLGPYSTGKTSFINYLIGQSYSGMQIGKVRAIGYCMMHY